MIGIPYAYVNEDGTRTCPECGERIPESHDAEGESTTNNYGEHFAEQHQPFINLRQAIRAAMQVPGQTDIDVMEFVKREVKSAKDDATAGEMAKLYGGAS